MVTRDQIEKCVNARVKTILTVAQAALPERQFDAFRRFTLDAFGKSGLGKDLDRIFGSTDLRPGKERAGRN